MKLVSAAKFHKAQESISRFSPYSNRILKLLSRIAPFAPDEIQKKWFSAPTELKKVGFVVITSNSSMCAGFNLNLLKHFLEEAPLIAGDLWGTEDVGIFCLGKKGGDFLKKREDLNVKIINSEVVNKPAFSCSADFCSLLMKQFEKNEFDAIYLVFNYFKNPAVQEPKITPILPFSPPEKDLSEVDPVELLFEPNKEYILDVLIPLGVKTMFHETILENALGEHGARMTAMHQATENAIELNKNLKLQYNKARQASITKEILEIVSGAEALKAKAR